MKRLALLIISLAAVFPVLAEEPAALPEVEVVGNNDAVSERRESITQKITVERKDIENMGVMTVGEVLGKLPGVELKGGDHRARGMSRDSVQILVNGERPASGGPIAMIVGRMPSNDLERVEILRGSSAEFGGAASVTVNLIMKKALPKSATEIRVGLGQRGTESFSQLAFKQTGGEGEFSWSLPVSLIWNNASLKRLADRQDTAAGVRTLWQQENESGVTKSLHHSISPVMTWKEGNDSLTLAPVFLYGPNDGNGNTALTAYANPVAGTGLAFDGDRATRENNQHRVSRLRVEGEKHYDEFKLTGRASFNNSKRTSDVVRDAHDALNVLTTSTEHTDSSDNETNLALRMDKPIGEHLLAVGAEHVNLRRAQDQRFTGNFTSVSSYQTQERQSIAWVQDDWMVRPDTTFTYGLRGESITLDSAGASQQASHLLPSVAVRWEPMDKWVLRSSLGAGLKMPKLDEISSAVSPSIAANTPAEADRRGNSNLRPEHNINFEALIERYLDGDAGVAGLNLYMRSTEDFIERRVQLEGARWVDRPYNEGQALHWGWELDGKLRTDNLGWKGATLKAHLTLPHAQVDDTRLGIQRMARDTPKYVFSTGLDESLPKLRSSYGFSIQLSGRSETDIAGEQHGLTRARATVDAFWLYTLTPQFKLRISGQNLLAADTEQETRYLSGNNIWQLRTTEGGTRTIRAILEGRW
ncbi:MAG: TonB-dependent receptor [Nitrosomonadales bacterium]|nr:TonB-dependent receptor [Nitrosomonadales bacterium]